MNNELANLQRELAKKNAELERLSQLKDQFLGMAAHDLRGPLANIKMAAGFLSDSTDSQLDEMAATLDDPEIEFAVLDYCGVSTPAFWRGFGAERGKRAVGQFPFDRDAGVPQFEERVGVGGRNDDRPCIAEGQGAFGDKAAQRVTRGNDADPFALGNPPDRHGLPRRERAIEQPGPEPRPDGVGCRGRAVGVFGAALGHDLASLLNSASNDQ